MPVIPGQNTSTSPILQNIVNQLRTYPEFTPILGTSGYTQEPALQIANDVMQRILSEGMPWKWNRAYIPPFLTVALQQDYPTQITDIGWLEQGQRVDINNSTNNGNLAPKPFWDLNVVRDLSQTSGQNVPDSVCFVPNSLAYVGLWQPNTAYPCGYGVAQVPKSPIQQFIDANGNLLYIDSTNLGLNFAGSQGYTTSPIALPSNAPYGISGSTQPLAPEGATPGTLIQDNTVLWTVADPNGYAIRFSPLPALGGLEWLISPTYQVKPPTMPSLQSRISPIPPEYAYLFRQGMRAMLYDHAGSKKGPDAYAKWEEDLVVAVRGADRQQESYGLVPMDGIMGDDFNGISAGQINIGPGWPYGGSYPWG